MTPFRVAAALAIAVLAAFAAALLAASEGDTLTPETRDCFKHTHTAEWDTCLPDRPPYS